MPHSTKYGALSSNTGGNNQNPNIPISLLPSSSLLEPPYFPSGAPLLFLPSGAPLLHPSGAPLLSSFWSPPTFPSPASNRGRLADDYMAGSRSIL